MQKYRPQETLMAIHATPNEITDLFTQVAREGTGESVEPLPEELEAVPTRAKGFAIPPVHHLGILDTHPGERWPARSGQPNPRRARDGW